MPSPIRPLVLFALVLTVAACAKKETLPNADSAAAANAPPPLPPAPMAITAVDLGKTFTTENGIQDNSDSFNQRDSLYVSVQTDGVGTGLVGIRWSTEAGKVIDSTSQNVTANGSGRTLFRTGQAKPWAVGKYQVDVTLNGVASGSKTFEIKRP
jgi:hypothetical protein